MEYKIRLKDFEGPLDLLLHLVRESKLDIKTVPLASVTAQFLEYMEQLDTLDLDLAAEFIEVASTLIEIKSRGILPKPTVAEDPEDIENKLRRQLEEYKLLKEASEKLKPLENVDRFYKPAVDLKPEYALKLDNLGLDALTAAFARLMHRIKQSSEPVASRKIRMDRFTVRDKIADIRTRIAKHKTVMFSALFDADFTKSEMINTFLALLELLKTGEVRATQDTAFADISIAAVPHASHADDINVEEDFK